MSKIKILNKEAVSGIVGVLLMVCITVAIALTTYYYVTTYTESTDDTLSVEGWTTEAHITTTITISDETFDVWQITLSDDYANPTTNETYYMFFSNDLTGPPTGVEIRCHYEEYLHDDGEIYYNVTEVESL